MTWWAGADGDTVDAMGLGAPELLIVLIIVLVIFGGAKLPKLAKSLGEAQREFKKSSDGEDEHPLPPVIQAPPAAAQVPPAAQAPPVVVNPPVVTEVEPERPTN